MDFSGWSEGNTGDRTRTSAAVLELSLSRMCHWVVTLSVCGLFFLPLGEVGRLGLAGCLSSGGCDSIKENTLGIFFKWFIYLLLLE